MLPHFFLKLYFARGVFLEIHFCVILKGIQNVFGSGTPRISSWALENTRRTNQLLINLNTKKIEIVAQRISTIRRICATF